MVDMKIFWKVHTDHILIQGNKVVDGLVGLLTYFHVCLEISVSKHREFVFFSVILSDHLAGSKAGDKIIRVKFLLLVLVP